MAPNDKKDINEPKKCLLATIEEKITQLAEQATEELNGDRDTNFLYALRRKLERILKTYKEYMHNYREDHEESEIKYFGSVLVDIEILLCDIEECVECNAGDRTEITLEKIRDLSLQDENTSNLKQGNLVQVRLPPISLIKFGGGIDKFQEFWENFENLIDKNHDLNDYAKLMYLKSLLYGEPSKLIKEITSESGNYQVAIDMLKRKYAKKQDMINLLYEKLHKINESSNNTTNLRYTFNTTLAILTKIKILDVLMSGSYMIPLLLSKFPKAFKLKIEESKSVDVWDFDTLKTTIEKLITARENAGIESLAFNSGSTRESKPNKFREKEINSKVCKYCNQFHWSDQCKKYPTAQDRIKQLQNNCHKCLGNHSTNVCKFKKNCYYCKSPDHHGSLCQTKFKRSSGNALLTLSRNGTEDNVSNNIQLYSNKETPNESALIPMFKGKIVNPLCRKKTMWACIILDSGSSSSYIIEKACDKIDLKCKHDQNIAISTFGSQNTTNINVSVVSFGIYQKDGKMFKMNAKKIPTIAPNIKIPNYHNIIDIKTKQELAGRLKPDNKVDVEILIGADYFWKIIKMEPIEQIGSLYVIDTIFGKVLSGTVKELVSDSINSFFSNHTKHISLQSVNQEESYERATDNLTKIWQLDAIGICDDPNADDNRNTVDHFNNTLVFNKNRYHIKWPLNQNISLLPENYYQCYNQLKSLVTRLDQNQNFLDQYDKIITQQKENGIIEVVDTNKNINKHHYIPHHLIIPKYKPTTKCRIVYNASYKGKGSKSLNDCLQKGPLLLNDLAGILLRMRVKKYIVICDIEKAFLQIGIQKEDRDLTRFLWLKDITKPFKNNNIITYRFKRIPFGIKSSPFLLCATLKYHLQRSQSKFAKKILEGCYMDNFIIGFNSIEEAIACYKEMTVLLMECSMNLHEWKSNDGKVNEVIVPEKQLQGVEINLLGILWNSKDDLISINAPVFIKYTPSKRSIAKELAKVFDPLGLLCPAMVKGKLMLKELWKESKSWDDQLTSKFTEKWNVILKEISSIKSIQIPRYIESCYSESQLIVFADASSHTYGCAIYLRSFNRNKWASNLLFAKSRVAPMKKITIPRLELTAVVVACRCATYVMKQLNITNKRFTLFTDSKCVIYWYNSTKQLSVYINNRLNELKKHENFELRYVPTLENPADITTRGMNPSELMSCKLWWNGPIWMQQSEDHWPKNTIEIGSLNSEAAKEFKKQEIKDGKVLLSTNHNDQEAIIPPLGINENRFSSLQKLLKVTAWCIRICQKFLKRNMNNGGLLLDEKIYAKKLWDLYCQKLHFPEMFQQSQENNIKKNLNLPTIFVDDDGLLRCCGRLDYGQFNHDEINPKLISKMSKYTELIIMDIHKKAYHSGVSHTLAMIRREYWIPKGRQQIKKVLKTCETCKILKSKPYKVPEFPPLPRNRITQAPPFTYVGIDYMGPILVKSNNNEEFKVWVCLYTCLVVRAIHLDMVYSLSTDEFLFCHRRFVARRGKPAEIISDNASQFTLAAEIIKKYFIDNDISWRFTTPFAPWKGGIYERLIGLVKRGLTRTFNMKNISVIELTTTLCEIEHIINDRPLTYIDENSIIRPISPNDFLILNMNKQLHEMKKPYEMQDEDIDATREKLIKNWRKGRRLLNAFWKIWKTEYLLSLRERYKEKLHNKHYVEKVPQIGDVVLVEENSPKIEWKIAKIEETYEGDDNKIRSALIKFSNGKMSKRSILHLYPIEL